jgi:hypothetical protein
MSLIQTCKCEECDMQKSFANHWVMLYERNGNLVILPRWDPKMMRRTRHFCGRAHASRYVERWIAGLALNAMPEPVPDHAQRKLAQPEVAVPFISDEEDEANALELATRSRNPIWVNSVSPELASENLHPENSTSLQNRR